MLAKILLVDKSGSLQGNPIEELNQGLMEFAKAMNEDVRVRNSADVCIISFDSDIYLEADFCPAAAYHALHLTAGGGCALNHAIETCLNVIEERQKWYREARMSYYRPFLFVLTAGAPTDSSYERIVSDRLRRGIGNRKVVFVPVGIGPDTDTAKIQSYYPADAAVKPVLKADAGNFKKAFEWQGIKRGLFYNAGASADREAEFPNDPSVTVIDI